MYIFFLNLDDTSVQIRATFTYTYIDCLKRFPSRGEPLGFRTIQSNIYLHKY